MKLRFSVKKQPIIKYMNVDPFPQNVTNEQCLITNINDSEGIGGSVADSQCYEVFIDECLSYIPYQQVVNFLLFAKSKIRRGGKLIICDTEINSVLSDYKFGTLDCFDLNKALFGDQDTATTFKSSCFCLLDIEKLLVETQGLRVVRKLFDGNKFIIEAVRD